MKYFLINETKGYNSICELGAGLFTNFKNFMCPVRVGIELVPEYIENRQDKSATAICGNILNYDELLDRHGIRNIDVFAMIDVLEHITKEDGISLIKRLQEHAKKIIVWAPEGPCHQDGTDSWDFFDKSLAAKIQHNKDLAIECQRHKSTWYEDDFLKLDFNVNLSRGYSKITDDCWRGREDEFRKKFEGDQGGYSSLCLD